MSTRASRRHHRQRLFNKRKDLYSHTNPVTGEKEIYKPQRYIDTPKVCSDPWCCGNLRAMNGKTRQERKFECSAKDFD